MVETRWVYCRVVTGGCGCIGEQGGCTVGWWVHCRVVTEGWWVWVYGRSKVGVL